MEVSFDDDEPFVFRLNDNGSGPSLLVKVCVERGWRMYQGYHTGLDERWNLWWRTSAFPSASYKTLGDWQFMNHIPKGGSICRKDNLSRLLRCMRRVYGTIYEFSPLCYHLPLEYAKLVSECSRLRRSEEADANVVWIHKPVAQSQGRGIFLFRSICDMSCGTSAVVQRYIERPLLIAGYKFDLRLYVCVPGYRPLTAYMYAEGLARFGTDKYTLSDIHNRYRHLTNSSLNKSGPRYAECKDRIGSGCKWTLTQVRKALVGRWGAAEWVMWQRIRALVTLTLLAQAAGTPPARNCFEFYGFDVLLDDSLKPWLLEVNLSPALAADCEADIIVKQPMLHELFDLLGLPMKHTGLAKLKAPPLPIPVHNSASYSRSVLKSLLLVTNVPFNLHENYFDVMKTSGLKSNYFCESPILKSNSRIRNERIPKSGPPRVNYDEPIASYSSEDESGGAGRGAGRGAARAAGRGAHARTAARRGARLRRRRALPLHCVTLHAPGAPAQPPADQTTAESSEKSKEPNNGRYKTNESADNADSQPTSSVPMQPAESVDESWRGGYSTAASRRRAMTACQWGNGVKWNQATGRVGHWVRIYPHTLPTGDELPMEDVRESVAQVTKFVRAAREVSRECGRDTSVPRDAARDAVFEAALREKLIEFGPHFQVWLPPF